MKNYFLMVNPIKGSKLKSALLEAALLETKTDIVRRIKRVLAELEGIHEMERGFSRQLILFKPELRLVADLNSKHGLGLEITDL